MNSIHEIKVFKKVFFCFKKNKMNKYKQIRNK